MLILPLISKSFANCAQRTALIPKRQNCDTVFFISTVKGLGKFMIPNVHLFTVTRATPLFDVFFNRQVIFTGKCRRMVIEGKQSLDRISVDQNCVLSLDRNYVNHLIEFFDTFHLIELFDQLIKKN